MTEASAGTNGGSGTVPEIDTTVAHSARVYDYWLGGKDNFEADHICHPRRGCTPVSIDAEM